MPDFTKEKPNKNKPTYSPTVHFCSVIGEKKQHLIVKLTQHCGAYVHPDPVMSLLWQVVSTETRPTADGAQ